MFNTLPSNTTPVPVNIASLLTISKDDYELMRAELSNALSIVGIDHFLNVLDTEDSMLLKRIYVFLNHFDRTETFFSSAMKVLQTDFSTFNRMYRSRI